MLNEQRYENLSPKAALETYVNEQDPVQRILLAEKVLNENSDVLAITYIEASEINDDLSESKIDLKARWDKNYADTIVETKPQQESPRIESFRNYFIAAALSRTMPEDTARNELKNNSWEHFLDALGLESALGLENNVNEPLAWLQEKINRNEVILIDSGLANDPELKKSHKETAKKLSAPFSLSGPESLSGTKKSSKLIICLDLIPEMCDGSYWLINLAHERGHDILNSYRETSPSTLGGTEIVFREFFAMMEELREYELIKHTGKDMPPFLTAMYELDENTVGAVKEGVLPNTNEKITLRYENSLISAMLRGAYVHSIESAHIHSTNQLLDALQKEGASAEDIIKKLRENKIITTPVIDSKDVEWKTTAPSTSRP